MWRLAGIPARGQPGRSTPCQPPGGGRQYSGGCAAVNCRAGRSMVTAGIAVVIAPACLSSLSFPGAPLRVRLSRCAWSQPAVAPLTGIHPSRHPACSGQEAAPPNPNRTDGNAVCASRTPRPVAVSGVRLLIPPSLVFSRQALARRAVCSTAARVSARVKYTPHAAPLRSRKRRCSPCPCRERTRREISPHRYQEK